MTGTMLTIMDELAAILGDAEEHLARAKRGLFGPEPSADTSEVGRLDRPEPASFQQASLMRLQGLVAQARRLQRDAREVHARL